MKRLVGTCVTGEKREAETTKQGTKTKTKTKAKTRGLVERTPERQEEDERAKSDPADGTDCRESVFGRFTPASTYRISDEE